VRTVLGLGYDGEVNAFVPLSGVRVAMRTGTGARGFEALHQAHFAPIASLRRGFSRNLWPERDCSCCVTNIDYF
jgi:hypothetical protein